MPNSTETKMTLGKSATASAVVTEHNTARTVGSGSLEVFATPMMIALIEQAACKALSDTLDDGQTSVGTAISVAHTAASPLNAEIAATATITSVNGRVIDFEVYAHDDAGEIGHGTHTRVIVDRERFMAKAQARNS
ncbi:thioesterase [Synergistales bacterium]|nr:thioesterase [Synergistales bacterium]